MPNYTITLSSTFDQQFIIYAESKDEAIFHAEDIASDWTPFNLSVDDVLCDGLSKVLRSVHEETVIHNIEQDEPSEEER